MTDQEANIAVAKALGYKVVKSDANAEFQFSLIAPNGHATGAFEWASEEGAWSHIANYGADLNAIRSAVLSHKGEGFLFLGKFQLVLEGVAQRKGQLFCQLDARDWREAFLRAVGRWKEGG